MKAAFRAPYWEFNLNLWVPIENSDSAYAPIAADPNDVVSVDKSQNYLNGMGGEVAVSWAKTVFYSDYRDILEQVLISCTIIQLTNDLAVPTSVGHYINGVTTLVVVDMAYGWPFPSANCTH